LEAPDEGVKEMFINYDVIREQAQRYNERLEALYVPVKLETERNIARRLAVELRDMFGGGKSNARNAKTNTAFMGHGVVAK